MTMLFLRLIILLLGITSIVTGCTKNSTGPQFNFEEDNPNAYEQVQTDFVNYLRSKLVELYKVMSTYGDNIAKAKGVLKIASEFEILVFGPPRSGKSTLIKEISGDETIETSAGMNACTSKPQEYVDKYGIHWWDTPGTSSIRNQFNIFKQNFF
jgi:ribosome biogenesis GTPase A